MPLLYRLLPRIRHRLLAAFISLAALFLLGATVQQRVWRDPTLTVAYRPLVEESVVYAQRDSGDLELTLCYPARSNGLLVLFFHAGGWVEGDRRVPGPDHILLALNEAGYVIASADYRLGEAGQFPHNLADCRAALAWCQANAGRLGIDPARIILMGASAGGHLAALTGSAAPDARWDVDPKAVIPPALVVGYFGIYDFTQEPLRAQKSWIRAMVGTDAWRHAASPAQWIDPTDPPVLLLCGTNDRTTPYAWTAAYANALEEGGVPVALLPIVRADHAFRPWGGMPMPSAAERRAWVAEGIAGWVPTAR